MDPVAKLAAADAVLVIDVQNDFCPGGSLAVAGGDRVVPILNRWMAAAQARELPVFASRDWHPEDHPSFQTVGGPWPRHCVQDSPGAQFHPDLCLPPGVIKITKGVRFDKDQHSVFDETGLLLELRRRGVRRLFVGGLALDVCVLTSVLDARREGISVTLLAAATRPVNAADGERALLQMRSAGALLEESERA